MFKNYEFSKKILDYVYAVIWFMVFTAFAVYIFSGEMFEPVNGKIHLVAILVAWIVEYIGLIATGSLFFIFGIYKALKTVLVKKENSETTENIQLNN